MTEYRETLKETKELFSRAYNNTKKVSTIQFARERYRIGILTKEQYINTLKREAGETNPKQEYPFQSDETGLSRRTTTNQLS